jgi:hypothetical protein
VSDYQVKPVLDAGKLWAGGFATAVVAALVAIVGIVLCRGIFDIPVLQPDGDGGWDTADVVTYALTAAAIALVATGLMHLLAIGTPTPTRFFGWILGLATLIAVALPLGLSDVLDVTAAELATAIINLAIGLAITFLLLGVARSSMTWKRQDA